MDLILIEGLPGSGKSTMAELLCESALRHGIRSSWHLEQAKDHPIRPPCIKSEKHEEVYPKLCLNQWRKFVSENEDNNQTFIFEGTLFQSTVRFMLEGNQEELVLEYYKECQSILSNIPSKLIYLRPTNAAEHIDWTMNHRGEEWTSKVAEYLEKTPYCKGRQWKGENCMLSFWAVYAQLCDTLVSQTNMPYHIIEAGNDHFEFQFGKAMNYINFEKWFNKRLLATDLSLA